MAFASPGADKTMHDRMFDPPSESDEGDALEACRQRWKRTGDTKALKSALTHLYHAQRPLPAWLVQAVRTSLPSRPSQIDARDWLRWWWVKCGRSQNIKWNKVYKFAAEHCGEHRSPGAVKASYLKVQSTYQDGSVDWRYPQVVLVADRGHLLRSIDANGITIRAGTGVMVEHRYDDGRLELRAVVNGVETPFRAHERDVKLRYNAGDLARPVRRS
jgi:hypothetical protein